MAAIRIDPPTARDDEVLGTYSIAVNATADGLNEVVAAVGTGDTARIIRVISFVLTQATAALAWDFRSGDTTVIAGPFAFIVGTGPVLPEGDGRGLFQTVAGEALKINTTATVDVTGVLKYQVV